jgi:hypothetical protein
VDTCRKCSNKERKEKRKEGFFLFYVVIFVILHQGFLNFQNTKQIFSLDKTMLSPLQTSATMVKIFNFQFQIIFMVYLD